MVDESVEQLKKQRVIEHMELALADLQRFQSSPIILNTMVQLHDALVLEYNALYMPAVEEEPKETKSFGKKEGKDISKANP